MSEFSILLLYADFSSNECESGKWMATIIRDIILRTAISKKGMLDKPS